MLIVAGVTGMTAEQAKVAGGTNVLSASGQAIFSGKTISFKTAIASWHEKQKILKLELYPVDLTAKEVAEIRKSGSWNTIIEKKPSPDKKLWNWVPSASITLWFENATGPFTRENVKSVGINFVGFGDKSFSTMCISLLPEPSVVTNALTALTAGPILANKSVALEFKSSGNDPAYSIDVKVATEIIKLSPF